MRRPCWHCRYRHDSSCNCRGSCGRWRYSFRSYWRRFLMVCSLIGYLIFSQSSVFSAVFTTLRTLSAFSAIAAVTVTAAALAWFTRRTL